MLCMDKGESISISGLKIINHLEPAILIWRLFVCCYETRQGRGSQSALSLVGARVLEWYVPCLVSMVYWYISTMASLGFCMHCGVLWTLDNHGRFLDNNGSNLCFLCQAFSLIYRGFKLLGLIKVQISPKILFPTLPQFFFSSSKFAFGWQC